MKKSGRDGFYRKTRRKINKTAYLYPVIDKSKSKKTKISKSSGWKLVKKYDVNYIMDKISNETSKYLSVRGGRTVKIRTQTTILFKEKGICCYNCGKSGDHFALEEDRLGTLRLRLIIPLNNNDFTIMTKDHIIPKSKGGGNIQKNYQPLCGICNNQKGNII